MKLTLMAVNYFAVKKKKSHINNYTLIVLLGLFLFMTGWSAELKGKVVVFLFMHYGLTAVLVAPSP